MNYGEAVGLDVIGYLAGALTTVAFVPQVLHIVRKRSAHDISWGMFSMFSVGVALWLWYGIRLASLPLIVANGITLTLVLTILVTQGALRFAPARAAARRRTHDTGATMKLAFLGLGVMGYPMAGHLSRAGHQVTVFNRTSPKAAKWTEAFGGSSAATPAAAAKGAEIVLMCVGNDDDVRAVIAGADGALAGMAAGTILVDHTTASAHVAREMHAAAAAKGVAFLDAPVSGGQAGAENGKLTIMVGGDAGDVRQGRSLCWRHTPAR